MLRTVVKWKSDGVKQREAGRSQEGSVIAGGPQESSRGVHVHACVGKAHTQRLLTCCWSPRVAGLCMQEKFFARVCRSPRASRSRLWQLRARCAWPVDTATGSGPPRASCAGRVAHSGEAGDPADMRCRLCRRARGGRCASAQLRRPRSRCGLPAWSAARPSAPQAWATACTARRPRRLRGQRWPRRQRTATTSGVDAARLSPRTQRSGVGLRAGLVGGRKG